IELIELRVREVVRIDVQEQELAACEPTLHRFDRLAATQSTELPQEIRFGCYVEHDLRAPQRAQGSAGERLVAVDLTRVGEENRMQVDVHGALAQTLLEIIHAPGALALLYALGRIGRLADPAIDEALEPDLRVVVDVRTAHVDLE